MTPSEFRAGAPGKAIRFAVGECSLGAILVAATDRGVCAILLGDDAERARARPRGPVSEGAIRRRRCGVRGLGREGRRLRRGARARARSAARRARDGFPAARVASAARHSVRRNRKLRPDCEPHRRRRKRRAPLRRRAPQIRSPSRFPVIASCGRTAACRATAGASSASVRCSIARRIDERPGCWYFR